MKRKVFKLVQEEDGWTLSDDGVVVKERMLYYEAMKRARELNVEAKKLVDLKYVAVYLEIVSSAGLTDKEIGYLNGKVKCL